MYETLGLEQWTPREASIVFGFIVGCLFGVLAQLTQFCLRRAVAGPVAERASARGVWLLALAFAILGTQSLIQFTPISFAEHRLMAQDIPIVAIVAGGLLFGVGMVLTRGCASRLTVLAAGGNLRAVLVLLIFALTAHATLKGVLAPWRVWLGEYSINLDTMFSINQLPGGPWVITVLAVGCLVIMALRSATPPSLLVGAALLGFLVPVAWFGTGWLLVDDFDPIPLEGLSFTLPHTQLAFWLMASSAIPASFGVALVGGVFTGSLITHLLRGQFRWQSFETPGQTGRYLSGGVLMAIGGVLAGGCSVGAGLSGVATLSMGALVALLSMITGATLSARLIR